MANISLNIQELHQLLESTPASHDIMLVGNHGIGKSQILTNYFKEKGMEVVALFLGQMADPSNLIGLPNEDEKTSKTDFIAHRPRPCPRVAIQHREFQAYH